MFCPILLLAALTATDWTVSPGESIQAAIDQAGNGDRILVAPGLYEERIDFRGRLLELIGVGGADQTVLDAQGTGPAVVAKSGEPLGTRIRGFTIQNGRGDEGQSLGGGVGVQGWHGVHTSLDVYGCTIMNNAELFAVGSAASATLRLERCTVRDNRNVMSALGSIDLGVIDALGCLIIDNDGTFVVTSRPSGAVMINNSIVWNAGIVQGHASITYSDVQGGRAGEGNIDADPLFADRDVNDYRLLPGSPCINSGDPLSLLDPDGTRADMGAIPFNYTTGGAPFTYCFGSEATCPCSNAGNAGAGCDNAQGTGGVRLVLTGYAPDSNGGGTAALVGLDHPLGNPTVLAIRADHQEPIPAVLGDGLRCLGFEGLRRLRAVTASSGVSVHEIQHGAGSGTFFYQLWYRNQPMSFCDSQAALNLSNAVAIPWP